MLGMPRRINVTERRSRHRRCRLRRTEVEHRNSWRQEVEKCRPCSRRLRRSGPSEREKELVDRPPPHDDELRIYSRLYTDPLYSTLCQSKRTRGPFIFEHKQHLSPRAEALTTASARDKAREFCGRNLCARDRTVTKQKAREKRRFPPPQLGATAEYQFGGFAIVSSAAIGFPEIFQRRSSARAKFEVKRHFAGLNTSRPLALRYRNAIFMRPGGGGERKCVPLPRPAPALRAI